MATRSPWAIVLIVSGENSSTYVGLYRPVTQPHFAYSKVMA
jgi:hypothetical protein